MLSCATVSQTFGCDIHWVILPKYDEREDKVDTWYRRSKTPVRSWKDTITSEEAQRYRADGYRLGVVIPSGIAVVDIDEPEEADRVYRLVTEKNLCNHIVKTKKGYHFYFRTMSAIITKRTRYENPLNLRSADIIGGEKGYVIWPDGYTNRQVVRWDGELRDIPLGLRPMNNRTDGDLARKPSFIHVQEGERNSSLYAWYHYLLNYYKMFPDEESARNICQDINSYLIPSPMSREEVSTLTRENRTSANIPKIGKGTIDAAGLSENELNTLAIEWAHERHIMFIGNTVHRLENGVYEPMSIDEVKTMIHRELSKNLTSHQRDEVLKTINVETYVNQTEIDTDYASIACANGYLDLLNMTLMPIEEMEKQNILTTVRTKWRFNPTVEYSPTIDECLLRLCYGDGAKPIDLTMMNYLYEIAGYSLLKSNRRAKFFILLGPGGTGKSTFCNLVANLYDKRWVSNVKLSQMDNDYYLARMVSSMLNIDDDASTKRVLEDAGRFKSITAGETVSYRQIYEEAREMTCRATCFICANRMPQIADDSTGLERRMVILEFKNPVHKPNPNFIASLSTLDMEYFFYKCCEGIHRVLTTGEFSIKSTARELEMRFKAQRNSVTQWITWKNITGAALVQVGDLDGLYAGYSSWARFRNYGVMNFNNWYETLNGSFDLKIERSSDLTSESCGKIIDCGDTFKYECPYPQEKGGKYVY